MQKKIALKTLGNKEEYARLYGMLNPKLLVSVYRNLTTGLWSVQQRDRVVCHCNYIVLRDVRYHVRISGREQVLREQKKNVHAKVKGYIVENPASVDPKAELDCIGVTYDPYKFETFVDTCANLPIYESKFVDMAMGNSIGVPVMAMK